jgi:hypothetical protein
MAIALAIAIDSTTPKVIRAVRTVSRRGREILAQTAFFI